MEDPSVSVVIPTYNRAKTLARAVDSVLAQTIDAFEVVVVDDGSTDATPELMASYTDNRVRYVRFEENRGANACRNSGIRSSSGEYLSFLDSDDEFTPSHLERVLATLTDAKERVGGVYTSQRFTRNGSTVDISVANDTLRESQTVIGDLKIGFSNLTFRRDVFDTVGTLDESLGAFQDREFLVRYLERYELVPVSDVLVNRYQHEDRGEGVAERISTDFEEKLDALEYLTEKHGEHFSRHEQAFTHYTKGYLHAKLGEFDAARREFVLAVRKNPVRFKYYLQVAASLLGEAGFWLINDLKTAVAGRLSRIRKNLTAKS
ncbi:glycosyltransferase family 2 protein [Halorientalis regularis]|uniref:Glycosyl transferase family 2 n=1 Tax=Halorientalis regularis TaxID=660518 RepID=A0A1G7HGG8_9EURY|nr:glycosyltransferase family 2 protein [Halorientalis regularis]SDE99426.1 Glycosyl transferase family 2 [Halorientalis regularis]